MERSDLDHSTTVELVEWLSRSGRFERVLADMLAGLEADMADEIMLNQSGDASRIPPSAIKHLIEANRIKGVLDFLTDVRSGRYPLVGVKVSTQ